MTAERSRSAAFPFAVLLLAGLAGCALPPEETPRAALLSPPAMDKTISATAEREAGDEKADHPPGKWPDAAWWTALHDPDLARLIETALKDNPDLKAASDRVAQAQALADSASAELLPSLGASGSYAAQHFSENSPFRSKFPGQSFEQVLINPVNFRQHLDFWGRWRAAEAAGGYRADAARAELADARLLLSTAVARLYVRLQAGIERLRLAEAMTTAQRDRLRVIRVRWEQGLDPRMPSWNAELRLEQALQREATQRAEIAVMRDQLAALAGQGPDWGRGIGAAADASSRFLPDHFPLPAHLPLELLAHRPDLAAARARVEAAAEEIHVARTAFYPNIDLTGFAGFQSVALSDVFTGGNAYSAIGPVLDLPLFTGGRLQAGLDYRHAAYDAAVEAYNGTLLRAVQQVADTLARWEEAGRRLDSQRGALDAMTRNRGLATLLNRAGLNNRGQMVEAAYTAFEQEFQLRVLESEYIQAFIALVEALGGGYAAPAPARG